LPKFSLLTALNIYCDVISNILSYSSKIGLYTNP
jgi:hypothetical protein